MLPAPGRYPATRALIPWIWRIASAAPAALVGNHRGPMFRMSWAWIEMFRCVVFLEEQAPAVDVADGGIGVNGAARVRARSAADHRYDPLEAVNRTGAVWVRRTFEHEQLIAAGRFQIRMEGQDRVILARLEISGIHLEHGQVLIAHVVREPRGHR